MSESEKLLPENEETSELIEPVRLMEMSLAPPSARDLNADLDFVCNEFVMYEKSDAQNSVLTRPFRTGHHLGVLLFLFSLLFFLCITAFTGYVLPNIHFAAFYVGTLAWIIFGTAGWSVYSVAKMLQSFPTNLVLSFAGLRLAWRTKDEIQSACIPWNAVTRIAAGKSWSGAGTGLTIDISLPLVSRSDRLLLIMQTASFWSGKVPWRASGMRLDFNTLSIQLPLDALTLEADQFRFIAALRSRVDPAAVTLEFNELLGTNKAPTFTQLWLDDMQSFRRQRIEELIPGTRLQDDRYEIHEKIATGGQAKIYSALDSWSNETVAVKELVLPVHAGAEVRNRAFNNVKNEALLLGSLSHPGIVKLLDNFVEDHRAYLVLEHIEGDTLRKIVQEGGALSSDKVSFIAKQLSEVLGYLHQQSPPIVHRDFTPDNLMLTESTVRLLDFNVAQQLESDTTKTVVGKHNYMAPEQFQGKPCTQSDLYSFGCTLFFLLTAKDPLPLACPRPSTKVSLPPELDEIVAKLTKPLLSERYASVSEVIAALDAASPT